MTVPASELLKSNKLGSFDALWELNTPWFEEPNYRRGGWSGVVKYRLNSTSGDVHVFIKRQENHLTRTWKHILTGIPTFEKEYDNIQRLRNADIPTLEPLFFGKSGQKAILVTKSLEHYQSLETLTLSSLPLRKKRQLINAVAGVISRLHKHHFQHNCLYAKHIFIKPTDDDWDVRLIDLEKMKRRLSRTQAAVRDLSTLSRHVDAGWTTTDRMRFMLAYMGEPTLSANAKKRWRQVAHAMAGKRR